MASIKITVSRGGYTSGGYGAGVSVGAPDLIEIDVPIPDRPYANMPLSNSEYMQLVGVTFDKTAELVDVVRGLDDVVDTGIADDEGASA